MMVWMFYHNPGSNEMDFLKNIDSQHVPVGIVEQTKKKQKRPWDAAHFFSILKLELKSSLQLVKERGSIAAIFQNHLD